MLIFAEILCYNNYNNYTCGKVVKSDTMDSLIVLIHDTLSSVLNSEWFSSDSVNGFIIIILMLCVVHAVWKRSVSSVIWASGMILFFQIMYILSLTGLNNIIPIGNIFKYDVLTSIAQCFVGTFVCDFLLWLDSFLTAVIFHAWDFLSGIIPAFRPMYESFLDGFLV